MFDDFLLQVLKQLAKTGEHRHALAAAGFFGGGGEQALPALIGKIQCCGRRRFCGQICGIALITGAGKKQASPMATQINELLTDRLKLTQRRQTRLNRLHGLPANEQRRQRNRKKSQAEERTNDDKKPAKPELAQ